MNPSLQLFATTDPSYITWEQSAKKTPVPIVACLSGYLVTPMATVPSGKYELYTNNFGGTKLKRNYIWGYANIKG
jgi:hypothetical protein